MLFHDILFEYLFIIKLVFLFDSYVAQIRIRVSVSEGYGDADTAIFKRTRYADTFTI
jgi:hypothetical protein